MQEKNPYEIIFKTSVAYTYREQREIAIFSEKYGKRLKSGRIFRISGNIQGLKGSLICLELRNLNSENWYLFVKLGTVCRGGGGRLARFIKNILLKLFFYYISPIFLKIERFSLWINLPNVFKLGLQPNLQPHYIMPPPEKESKQKICQHPNK